MPTPHLVSITLATFCLLAPTTSQAPITWTVKTMTGPSDVSTKGELCIAVNMGPEVCEKVVHGVHFQADRSHWTRKILMRGGSVVRGVMHFPDWTSGGFVLKAPYNRTAPGIGARDANNAAYDHVLKDGRHSSPGTHAVTCSIEGLRSGSRYEIQIFYGNKGRPTRITEWDNGVGGREGKGGIFLRPTGSLFGQVATGTFTAHTSGKQTFTNHQQAANPNTTPPLKATHNACSAIQIRELTPKTLGARATYFGEGTPGTNTQPNLGGTKCSPGIAFTAHPLFNVKARLTAENSLGAATSAMVVLGLKPLNLPFLQGTLLVDPALTIGVPMPAPASPYVHDHELQIPVTIPAAPIPVYVQVLQLDKGAAGGVSFTAGMKIAVGL